MSAFNTSAATFPLLNHETCILAVASSNGNDPKTQNFEMICLCSMLSTVNRTKVEIAIIRCHTDLLRTYWNILKIKHNTVRRGESQDRSILNCSV